MRRVEWPVVAVAFAVGLVLAAMLYIAEGGPWLPKSARVATTSQPAPSTTWPQTYVTLPVGFSPERLTTTTSAPRAKVAHAYKPARMASSSYDVAALEQIIRDGFARFGPVVAEEAVNVAWCETGGTLNPNATGDEGEVGLLQIHPRYHTGRAAKFGWSMADLYDPAKNVVVAADLFAEKGWGPWTCRTAA